MFIINSHMPLASPSAPAQTRAAGVHRRRQVGVINAKKVNAACEHQSNMAASVSQLGTRFSDESLTKQLDFRVMDFPTCHDVDVESAVESELAHRQQPASPAEDVQWMSDNILSSPVKSLPPHVEA